MLQPTAQPGIALPATNRALRARSRLDVAWFMLFAGALLLVLGQLSHSQAPQPLAQPHADTTPRPALCQEPHSPVLDAGHPTDVATLQQREQQDTLCAHQAALARD